MTTDEHDLTPRDPNAPPDDFADDPSLELDDAPAEDDSRWRPADAADEGADSDEAAESPSDVEDYVDVVDADEDADAFDEAPEALSDEESESDEIDQPSEESHSPLDDYLYQHSSYSGEDWDSLTGMESGASALDLDIDAALAAVASLSDVAAEQEMAAQARADARLAASSGAVSYALPLPPLLTLRRGHLASLLPALLLIGLGAWLTLANTAGTPPDASLVLLVGAGGVIVMLLVYWLSSGRWARGALFVALSVLISAGIFGLSLGPNGLDLVQNWPLLVVGVGAAVGLTALLGRPSDRRLFLLALLLIVAGLTGLVVTHNLLPSDWLPTIAPYAPVVVAVVAFLWLLPLIFKRRR
jgi:hypothetical protein